MMKAAVGAGELPWYGGLQHHVINCHGTLILPVWETGGRQTISNGNDIQCGSGARMGRLGERA